MPSGWKNRPEPGWMTTPSLAGFALYAETVTTQVPQAHAGSSQSRYAGARKGRPGICGYGVLYAARSARGAFAETFLRDPGRTLLPRDLIDRTEYRDIEVMRTLRMARLYGNGLAVLGCTARVMHGGRPYDLPQS
jgi:hypothetical protein